MTETEILLIAEYQMPLIILAFCMQDEEIIPVKEKPVQVDKKKRKEKIKKKKKVRILS